MDPIYEFRTYFADVGRVDDLYTWWRDHIVAVYADHFDLLGVFENHATIEAPARGVSVLIRYPDAAAAERSLAALLADPRTAELNSLPAPLTRDIVLSYERNFLTVADFSPSPGVVAAPA
jgi:hypothetical protein